MSPSSGSGTYCAMSCSPQTLSAVRLSTSGRAMMLGTGVTRPTHRLESRGVSTGARTMMRLRRPATAAYPSIMPSYVVTSGPPMSKVRLISGGRVAQLTR